MESLEKLSVLAVSKTAVVTRHDMDLINDLGTDLALAFLVERRYRQKIDPKRARSLIEQVRRLLESSSLADLESPPNTDADCAQIFSAH